MNSSGRPESSARLDSRLRGNDRQIARNEAHRDSNEKEEDIKMNRAHFACCMGLILSLFILGCAADYGKIRTVEEGGMTVEALVGSWSNFNMYYAGSKPEIPVAVLFDPKNDGKNLQVDPRWEKVTDEKTLQQMVHFIKTQPPRGVNMPRLWKVLGPDGTLYGYVYTLLVNLVITPIDQNTVRVENLV
jgi:hypothetical protein